MPYLSYKEQKIFYRRLSSGKKTLIAFHGFADSTELFEGLSTQVGDEFGIIAIDLPYHGETQWTLDSYTPYDVYQVVCQIINAESIERFSLICHSMGGRIVLGLLPYVAAQVEAVYFCASAGFQYTFSESKFFFPRPLRIWVAKILDHPKRAERIFNTAKKLGLINKAAHKLFSQQIDIPRRRKRMLYSWTSLCYFPLMADKGTISLLNEHQIEVHFFTGKKDTITPIKHVLKFKKRFSKATVHEVNGSHFFMRKQFPIYFSKWRKTIKSKSC